MAASLRLLILAFDLACDTNALYWASFGVGYPEDVRAFLNWLKLIGRLFSIDLVHLDDSTNTEIKPIFYF
jgi:hypothetical protein